jgi:Uri superfamily endonuclease
LRDVPESSSLRGFYALLVSLSRDISIEVGSLGIMCLGSGTYFYVGSGLGSGSSSIEGRLSRHFGGAKSIYWHIDYLLSDSHAKAIAAIYSKTYSRMECKLVKRLLRSSRVRVAQRGFGSSGCSCISHLVLLKGLRNSKGEELIWQKFKELGLRPKRWTASRSR